MEGGEEGEVEGEVEGKWVEDRAERSGSPCPAAVYLSWNAVEGGGLQLPQEEVHRGCPDMTGQPLWTSSLGIVTTPPPPQCSNVPMKLWSPDRENGHSEQGVALLVFG